MSFQMPRRLASLLLALFTLSFTGFTIPAYGQSPISGQAFVFNLGTDKIASGITAIDLGAPGNVDVSIPLDLVAVPFRFGNPAVSLAVSPDGSRFYVVDTFAGKSVLVFNSLSPYKELTPINVGELVLGISVSPDGRLLYLATSIRGILVYDTVTYQQVTSYPAPRQAQITSLALSADGNTLYFLSFPFSGGSNSSIYAANTSTKVTQSTDIGARLASFTLSPDGQTIYFPSGSQVLVFKTATQSFSTPLTLPAPSSNKSITVSNDGTKLFIPGLSASSSFFVVDLANGNAVTTIATSPVLGGVISVAMSPDSSRLFVASIPADTTSKGCLTVLDATTDTPIGEPYPLLKGPQQAEFANVAHALTFYLHGNNSTGLTDPNNPDGATNTFVMDTAKLGTAETPELLGEQSFYTYELLTGSFTANSNFQVLSTGGVALGVGATFTLYTTAADGTSATQIATASQLIDTGTVILTPTQPIPPLAGQRLLLTVSGATNLDLGGSLTLQTPSFLGAP